MRQAYSIGGRLRSALLCAPLTSALIAGALAGGASAATAPLPKPRPSPEAKLDPSAPVPSVASAGDAVPIPRPEVASVEVPEDSTGAPYYGYTPDPQVKAILDLVSADQYDSAEHAAAQLGNPEVESLVTWLVARAPNGTMSAADILKVLETHKDWPELDKIRLRAEAAFHAIGPSDEDILAFYSETPPQSIGGLFALARALAGTDRQAEAQALARRLWREENLSDAQAARLISRFGIAITPEDHRYRFRRLVLERRNRDALVQAKVLGPAYEKLARAVFAVASRDKNSAELLKQTATELTSDPLYLYARSRVLRREGEVYAAARLMLRAPKDPAEIGGLRGWWDERRDLSRMLLDQGMPKLAYRIVTETPTEAGEDFAEREFLAGWYALRFIKDPAKAEPHFKALAESATMPRTRARAYYWLGRTYEESGRTLSALAVYNSAAEHGSNYYGQLAREKVGYETTGAERTPAPSGADRLRFAARPAARMIELLVAGGHPERAFPFLKHLGDTVETPGEATLTTQLATRIGQPRSGMIAAALAEKRGIQVGGLTTPFLGVPSDVPLPDSVDRALVYAVARQESAFNVAAESHVGARGLMQLMPSTAKATASAADLPFSLQRLTTDPLYNATLGAHHLGELLDNVDGSYVLTFVGYNAGPSRANKWVEAYGDPRSGADAVDWVERIPFDETRNYVQKVMENLQIYRSRLGHPLSLSTDLVRGARPS